MSKKSEKVEYLEDKYFTWKIEGNVATMQRLKSEAFSSCKDVTAIKKELKDWDETYVETAIENAKKRGITTVEWYVDPRVLDVTIQNHESHGRKLEVIRTEKDGTLFCRLSL